MMLYYVVWDSSGEELMSTRLYMETESALLTSTKGLNGVAGDRRGGYQRKVYED